MIMFLKNMTMAGGFLVLAKAGAPGFGMDGVLSSRNANHRDDVAVVPMSDQAEGAER